MASIDSELINMKLEGSNYRFVSLFFHRGVESHRQFWSRTMNRGRMKLLNGCGIYTNMR